MPDYVGFLLNDNVCEVDELQDVDGAYLNAATVQVTLVDNAGANVAGETWPLAMGYVAASDGRYRGTLADTLTLSRRRRYRAIVTADAGAGLNGRWDLPVHFIERRS